MKRIKRTRGLVWSVLAALVVALLAFGLSSVAVKHLAPKFQLTAGKGFIITSTIYNSYPSCSATTTTKLYPGGTARCIKYTVHNSLTVPITVTSITVTKVAVLPTSTTKCKATDIIATNFSGTLHVTAKTTASTTEKLLFKTDGTQDACENRTVAFTFHGNAYFRDTTATTLMATPTTAVPGATVTLTASVKATNPTYDTTSPTGHVTFVKCTTATTCPHPVTLPTGTVTVTKTGTSGKAVYSTHSLATGTTYLEAQYATGKGTPNFVGSHSKIVSVLVEPSSSCVTAPKPTTSTFKVTGTHSGKLTIGTNHYWLDGGSITGPVSIGPHGSLVATGGTLGSNVTSSGGAISLQGTSVKGSVTTSGPLAIGPGTKVKGNSVTITGSGPVCMDGTGPGAKGITLTGNINVTHLAAGHVDVTFCAVTAHNFTYETNGEPLIAGGPVNCTGNKFAGNMTVKNNSAEVTIENNTVTGNITVSGDKGGTLYKNSAKANCELSSNTPNVVGSTNTAKGKTNTCNGTA